MKIRIGTRGSNLAMIQTENVARMIRESDPSVETEIVVINTLGDVDLVNPLKNLGTSGVFVKEIEKALLEGRIDMAVHSMKDMPSIITEGLAFVNPPAGEDPRDVIVSDGKIESLKDLKGGILGTGSPRRYMQLKRLIGDISFVNLRGNIETRMRKIKEQDLSGAVLAAAGLKRAGHEGRITRYLSVDEVIPAPCQGILALQIREDNSELRNILEKISDAYTTLRYETERRYQKVIGGTCHSPIGVTSIIEDEHIRILGCFGDEDRNILIRDSIEGHVDDRLELAEKLALRIREALR